jgi:hypothetical protein
MTSRILAIASMSIKTSRVRWPWPIVFSLAVLAGMSPACSRVLAQDCVPPVRVCELANSEQEIFIGRVVSSMDETGSVRVQVLRTYRGLASGEITVAIVPTPGLREGETYLFYSSRAVKNHRVWHQSDVCSTKPLSSVAPDELAVLDGLKTGSPNGSVFGTLERNLNFQDHEPIVGIQLLLNNGKQSYSGATDQGGKFDIGGLPPGVYRMSAKLPEALFLDESEPIEIFPHGCFNADLSARNNATISGRIALPPGVKVAGTKVFAIPTSGGGDTSGIADSQGRYTIRGLPVGEYVVGINVGNALPRLQAPFPPTYFPGSRDPETAKKFAVSGPGHFSSVDISVPVASEVVRLTVKATYDDGRPVPDGLIGISYTGAGARGGGRTNSKGIASLSVARGERFWLLSLSVPSGCFSPVTVGPKIYPKIIHLVYTTDACREQFNIEHAGFLLAQVHDKFSQVPVTVSFPDGSPAYNADVGIVSQRTLVPFASAFLTDKKGSVDLPIPANQEFRISASIHRSGTNCDSQALLFNTDSGIRWREAGSSQSNMPGWDNVSTSTGPIHLVLGGGSCKPGTP